MDIYDLKRHPAHYLILIIGLVLAVSTFFFSHTLQLQQVILITTGLFYIGWGIIHHYSTHHLTIKIVLEYALVAIIAIVIINALLLNK